MDEPDDAPLDRTGEAATKADLFDAAHWLDRRISAIGDRLAEMESGSGDITEKITGDLAGIRAEQMHLARRIELLSAELRADIRKELHRVHEVEDNPETRYRPAHGAAVLMALLIAMFVTGMLVLLGLVLLPGAGMTGWIPEPVMDWLSERGL